jgi:flagellar biosynthesis GTPase FlhF
MSAEVNAAQTALSNAQAALRQFDTPLATLKASLDRAIASKNKRSIESAEAAYVNRKTQDSSDRKFYLGAVTSAQNRLTAAKAAQAAEDAAAQAAANAAANAAAQAAANAAAQAAAQAAANAAAQAAANAAAQAAIDEANRKRAEQEERDRQAAAAAAEQARQEAIARMPKPLVVSAREPVKYATPSDVLIDINDLPVDLILKLTLEKIGGLELISLVRHDTVNGQNIVYRPIKNISQLAIDYNPQNMVKMPDSADSYFKNFPIKLENHIQQTTNELPPLVAYIDSATENVIIDVVNIKADYEIEVQMVSSGKVFDATIYMEDYSS